MAYNPYGGEQTILVKLFRVASNQLLLTTPIASPYGRPPGFGAFPGQTGTPPGMGPPPGMGKYLTQIEILKLTSIGPPPGMSAPGTAPPPGVQQASNPQGARPSGIPASF